MNAINEEQHIIGKIKYLGDDVVLYSKIDPTQKKINVKWLNGQITCISPEPGEYDLTKALKKFYSKECRKLVNDKIKIYQPLFKEK